jgi:hypothetical protein
MDWIFDNLQLIIVIGGAVAYWLNQRKREKEGQEADYDGDGVPEARGPVAPNADALEEAERTRRIQEEIRRKILERRGGTPPPVAVPAPAAEYREEPEWLEEGPRPRPAPVAPPPLEDAVLARQRALQEQLQALEERRAAARAKSTGFPPAPSANRPARLPGMPSTDLPELVASLRNPAAVRRAILLREVLGPPVSLR